MLDVHVGQTDVPTGSPRNDPRRNLPPSPMSPGDGGVSLSLLVPLMGKYYGNGTLSSYVFSPDGCYPG